MFCTHCGKEINDNSKFCYKCGLVIDKEAKYNDLFVNDDNKGKVRYDKIIFTAFMVFIILIVARLNLVDIDNYFISFNLSHAILIFSGIVAGPIGGGILGMVLAIYDVLVSLFEGGNLRFFNTVIYICLLVSAGALGNPLHLFIKNKLLKNSKNKNIIYSFILFPISILFFFKISENFKFSLLFGGDIALILTILLNRKVGDNRKEGKMNILSLIISSSILMMVMNFTTILKIVFQVIISSYFFYVDYIFIDLFYSIAITSIVVILGAYLIKGVKKIINNM